MLYKFKTRNAGTVIMTAPVGDQVLRAAGREPSEQGIFEPADMPALMAALEAAIKAESVQADDDASHSDDTADADAAKGPRAVGLKQRAWPLLDMLKRASADAEPIVWGV